MCNILTTIMILLLYKDNKSKLVLYCHLVEFIKYQP